MSPRTQSRAGGPGSGAPRPVPLSPLSLVFLAGLLGAPRSAAAQNPQLPSPAQAQQLLEQNPQLGELIRQRLQQSGLTPDEIRARLAASGYPSNLLDAYIGLGTVAQAAPGAAELAAIQALGLAPVQLGGLPVDTGAVQVRGLSPAPPSAVFGVDVFRRTTTQFLPLLAGPVPPDYKLGPGDQLVLILTGDVELAYSLQVTREGFILIPQVGQVFVANLTLEQLRDVLYARLGRVYSGVKRGPNATTRFDVSVANVRANQVYVVGEVTQPGAYQISALGTVLTALYAAGGVTERANLRHVEVRRLAQVVDTLDLYDYLLRGDSRHDIRLEAGDVVFVPVHGVRAQVTGAVKRPAIYELKGKETLRDLIQAAGGFRAEAALRRISISRIVPPEQRSAEGPDRVVVDVPLSQAQDGQVPPVAIEPGDVVTVFAVPEGRRSVVELKGAVYHPGTYGFRPGMRLSELIRLAGGFRPAVYAGQATIERLNLTDSTRYIVRVPLPADSTQPYPDDAQLQDYDIVNVYGREALREDRTVSIAGMVNEPGTFPYRNGMTLRDLVLMARGLRDGAYLDSAEVARLAEDRSGGRLAVTLRVPLDSSYLFEPDSTTYPLLRGLPGRARGTAPEVVLEPFDHVLILKQPEFEYPRKVTVVGEVRFPGTYVLARKDERLSQVLAEAGGLTPQAYADGIRFVRRENNVGRINVDLKRALADTASASNLILQPGDSVEIPEYQPVVKVTGEVNSPGSVLWKKGAGLDYYIGGAGGFTYKADKRRVHVKYANGEVRAKKKVLLFSTSPAPGPGAEVFVPVRDTLARTNFVQLFSSIAQIVASAVTTIFVIKHL
jgi:polysaccharide export outer membrane protein